MLTRYLINIIMGIQVYCIKYYDRDLKVVNSLFMGKLYMINCWCQMAWSQLYNVITKKSIHSISERNSQQETNYTLWSKYSSKLINFMFLKQHIQGKACGCISIRSDFIHDMPSKSSKKLSIKQVHINGSERDQDMIPK